MAHIEVPAGMDMFQFGYNMGFQNGLCAQVEDAENTALHLPQDIFFYQCGYDTGYIGGQRYRLSKETSDLMLTREMTKHADGVRRREQKHSSVFWFMFWSFVETGTRLLKPLKSIW